MTPARRTAHATRVVWASSHAKAASAPMKWCPRARGLGPARASRCVVHRQRGRAGRNFGAGMSNGVAYVFDEADTVASRLNHEMVLLADLDPHDTELLSRLRQLHQQRTNSARARWLLDGWEQQLPRCRKVKPRGSAKSAAGGRSAWIGCWRCRWRGRARAAAVRGWTMVNEQPDREFARIFADGIGVPSGVVEQHQSRTFALCLHPRAFASIRGEAVCC